MWLEYWGKTTDDYSAMRGPCGVGFHVPLKTEWQKLKTMMDSLSFTTWDDWRIKLHMPFSGKRGFNNAELSFQWVYWCYWMCMCGSGNPMQACHLNISSSQVSANYITSRADGLSIRPFKDVPVIPTSSRTTIYEWGTWWDWTNWYTPWIFWDQANWLISISSNWKTTDSSVWVTITDKNLWATTVYSDWNTLSQSNCWNYFQRWNNYWFAWSWSITTSQTQVDASWYWPWNCPCWWCPKWYRRGSESCGSCTGWAFRSGDRRLRAANLQNHHGTRLRASRVYTRLKRNLRWRHWCRGNHLRN